MSFQGLTPESLLDRSDSKNPATTCRGITSAGRPCRRVNSTAVSSSTGISDPNPFASRRASGSLRVDLASLSEADVEALFCWQHKMQAADLLQSIRSQAQRRKMAGSIPLQGRSSIETLTEKLGIIDLNDGSVVTPSKPERIVRRDSRYEPRARIGDDAGQFKLDRPRIHDRYEQSRPPRRRTNQFERPVPRPRKTSFWSCCFGSSTEYRDDERPARHRPPLRQHSRQEYIPPRQMSQHPSARPFQPTQYHHQTPHQQRQSSQLSPSTPVQPLTPGTTQHYLSLIPNTLPPSVVSSLLAELSKPISPADEAGYIYIFWLTPETDISKPDDDIASTILDVGGDDDDDEENEDEYNQSDDETYTPSRSQSKNLYPTLPRYKPTQSPRQTPTSTSRTQQQTQLTAQALSRFASIKHTPQDSAKILLKIGRAANIHRRMTQWTKQCNQNITLVRYYPHHKDAAVASPSSTSGTKCPHIHRVERLIHLELRGMGLGKEKELCAECGREHKEWFEVDATRKGLKVLDGVVRRWVGWAESVDQQ